MLVYMAEVFIHLLALYLIYMAVPCVFCATFNQYILLRILYVLYVYICNISGHNYIHIQLAAQPEY